jgi:hypothetical protein
VCQRGEWNAWLEQEFAWEEITARRFIGVYELAGKAGNFSDLSVPVSGLYALARPSTPGPVRTEVIQRAESGERFTHAQVKDETGRGRLELRSILSMGLIQTSKAAALVSVQIPKISGPARARGAGRHLLFNVAR